MSSRNRKTPIPIADLRLGPPSRETIRSIDPKSEEGLRIQAQIEAELARKPKDYWEEKRRREKKGKHPMYWSYRHNKKKNAKKTGQEDS